MYNPWLDATVLAMESSGVIYLRALKLAFGGQEAEDESRRMVSEKLMANAVAASTLMMGGSVQAVIAGYRAVVDANATRLLVPPVMTAR